MPGAVKAAAMPTARVMLPFDVLRVGAAVVQGWKRVLLAAVCGAAAAGGLGWRTFETKYTAQVQIVRREMTNTNQASESGESFKPRQFNAATITAMMRAGSLMEKTARGLQPAESGSAFGPRVIIRPIWLLRRSSIATICRC